MKRNLRKFVTIFTLLLTTLGVMLFISCSKDSTSFTNIAGGDDDDDDDDEIKPVLGQNPFVTTWSNTRQVTIPMNPDLEYDFVIQWGKNGTTERVTNENASNNGKVLTKSHTFSNKGPHTISISGKFPAIQFGVANGSNIAPFNANVNSRITSIDRWGSIKWESMKMAFAKCTNLIISNNDIPDMSRVRDFSAMLIDAKNANPKVSQWNFIIRKNSTDMDLMLDNSGMGSRNYTDMLERLRDDTSGGNAGIRLTARGIRYCVKFNPPGDFENETGIRAALSKKGFSIVDAAGTTSCK